MTRISICSPPEEDPYRSDFIALRLRTSKYLVHYLTDEQLLAESIAALTYSNICREEIARRDLRRKKKGA